MNCEYGGAVTIIPSLRDESPGSSKGDPGLACHARQNRERCDLRSAPSVSQKRVDQQPPGFFEQSIGCASIGVMADPTNSPTPSNKATANSNFRIEALPRLSNRTRDRRNIVSSFKQVKMQMRSPAPDGEPHSFYLARFLTTLTESCFCE
jgi:hypothetical protein